MVVSNDIKTRIENSMLLSLEKFEKAFGKSPPVPRIEFKKLGRPVAHASWKVKGDPINRLLPKKHQHWSFLQEEGFTMVVNPDYLIDNLDFVINTAVPHEMAHVASVFFHGHQQGKGHGRIWKQMMRILGLNPNRVAHGLEMENVTIRERKPLEKQYGYRCQCLPPNDIRFVTKIRHNRVQSGKYRSFYCPRCYSQLVFVG